MLPWQQTSGALVLLLLLLLASCAELLPCGLTWGTRLPCHLQGSCLQAGAQRGQCPQATGCPWCMWCYQGVAVPTARQTASLQVLSWQHRSRWLLLQLALWSWRRLQVPRALRRM
jgi:hypothetical protein